MKALRTLSAVLAVGLAACSGGGGGGTPTQPTVASVTVSPSAPTLNALGSTQQFTAKALDASGNTVTGVTATWSSANTGIATISAAGLATAVAEGNTNITATIDGVSGSTVLTVSVPQQTCSNPTPVSLAVGEFVSFASPNCILLPSGSSGDRYRVTVLRTVGTGDDPTSSDTVTATVSVTGVGVTAAPAAPVAQPSAEKAAISQPWLDTRSLTRALEIQDATEAMDAKMWAEAADLALRVRPGPLLPAHPGSTLLRDAAKTDLPAKLQFDPATPSDCTTGAGHLVPANLVYQNADMAIYQDSAQQDTLPITQSAAQMMADYYSTYAKGMITSYFGPPPDVDGNGKIIVYVSPAVTGDAAAYVWSGDFYPKTATGGWPGCAASNQRDMIWFNVGLVRALDAPASNSKNWQALETVAHEAKHVVSLYNRIDASLRSGTNQFNPTWLEEGTAEIAGGMSSRIAWAAHGGPAVGAQVKGSDFSAANLEWEYGVILRVYRTIRYLSSQPNGLVVAPVGHGTDESVYGSGWHFHAWLGDGYGHASTPMADSSLFRLQADSMTAPGTQGLLTVTGQTFPTLVEQFIVAMSLTGTTAPQPSHAFSTIDYSTAGSIFQGLPVGVYPYPVTTGSDGVPTKSFATATYAGPIGAWGIRMHDFLSNGTGTGAQIQVAMPGTGRVIVVRVN